mmetsp:Transcript_2053/g.6239  ORF Transcript_2053/g.6239 Transcript_2053/m.6239 type:complete len:313 (-) Transcript_2053:1443-2381(-)
MPHHVLERAIGLLDLPRLHQHASRLLHRHLPQLHLQLSCHCRCHRPVAQPQTRVQLEQHGLAPGASAEEEGRDARGPQRTQPEVRRVTMVGGGGGEGEGEAFLHLIAALGLQVVVHEPLRRRELNRDAANRRGRKTDDAPSVGVSLRLGVSDHHVAEEEVEQLKSAPLPLREGLRDPDLPEPVKLVREAEGEDAEELELAVEVRDGGVQRGSRHHPPCVAPELVAGLGQERLGVSNFLHLVEHDPLPPNLLERETLGGQHGVGREHNVLLEEHPQALHLVACVTRADPPLALLGAARNERAMTCDGHGGGDD